jgi:endonuclease/exonuclease/phosphatase family metal-dependent hydrolase
MKIVSWNIQWSRGVDGVVDPRRIVDDVLRLAGGEPDVLCLQEVAANFPELAGSAGEDQFAIFRALLPAYEPVAAAGVDIVGPHGRRRFGNLLLSRLPVLRVLHHQLPWPVDHAAKSMPRTASAVTLDAPFGALVVMNTHLEHFSPAQRRVQVEALRELHAENCLRAIGSGVLDTSGSPYHAVAATTRTLLTGDFNFRPDDPLHARLCAPFDERIPRLVDAWEHLQAGQQHPRPHPHNAGLYDRSYFTEPHTSDFFYASKDLLPHVRRFEVDGNTRSSDHQPQLLELT